MQIFHNPHHAKHHPQMEMFRGKLVPCHENDQRLAHVLAELARRPVGTLQEPGPADRSILEAVHTPDYLDFLASAWTTWCALAPDNATIDILPSVWPVRGFRHAAPSSNFTARLGRYSFDAGSPMMAGTWEAALSGAACAIDAARSVAKGGPHNPKHQAMALTRPPGHHAGPDFFGGYCFINNSAVAAQTLRNSGLQRVAVLDIDYHHGNGTQTIFYDREDVFTVSIHGDPQTEYPFYLGYADERGEAAGTGANRNYPLPAGTGFRAWRQTLETALQAIRDYGAEAIVLALGVDTFEGDPISRFLLRSPDYLEIGAAVATTGLPTVVVMEGGYAVAEVGINVVNVLEGLTR